MSSVIFINDNNVELKLIEDTSFRNKRMITRPNHEKYFRQIHTYLFNNNLINKNLIDGGSWIGDNTIPWALNTSNIVYSIDPSIENCDYINKMCVYNNITNVKTINIALAKEECILKSKGNINMCSFVYNNKPNGNKISASATTLDILMNSNIITDIDYLHLDIEGMEYDVLLGANELINKYNPIITYEQHIDTYDKETKTKIYNYLTRKNYKIYMVNEIIEGNNKDCRNFFAFPNNFDINHINIINKNIKNNLLISVK